MESPSLMEVPILDDDGGGAGGGCHVAQLNRVAVAALHYFRVCNNNVFNNVVLTVHVGV
jgi:hypothetical protein